MSENTRKQRAARTMLIATTLTTAYAAGWESAVFDTRGLDELKLLLTLAGFDGTSLELKSLVAPDASASDQSPGAFFTELASDGTIDELQILAAVITSEGNQIALSFGVQQFNHVKIQAKRTGGAAGTLAMTALGG